MFVLWLIVFNYTNTKAENHALLFDGANDYVHAPYISAYQLPVITVEAWVRPNSDLSTWNNTTSGGSGIVGRGEDVSSDNDAFSFGVACSNNPWGHGLGLGYENSNDDEQNFNTNFYPPVNSWTHLATTRSSDGQINIYVNGNLYSHWDSSDIPTSNCFQEFTFGADWANGVTTPTGPMELVGFFPGMIDEVRIWNVARSEEEILENYNKIVSLYSPGLVGYWNFDEGNGTIAHDLTGLNNATLGLNGTGTDVPIWTSEGAPVPEPTTLLLLGLGAFVLRKIP